MTTCTICGATTGRTGEAAPLVRATVPGEPIPKQRPRVGRHGGKTPLRTVEAELRFAWHVKEAATGLGLPRDGLFRVEVVFRSQWPQGDRRGCDVDNACKLALDALNGVVWRDDAQVVELIAKIERGVTRPETEIAIYEEAA